MSSVTHVTEWMNKQTKLNQTKMDFNNISSDVYYPPTT